MLQVILVLWVAWTFVSWDVILESEHPALPQKLFWCAAQVAFPFLGWPLYLLFGTGYLAAMDEQLWPHRHQHGSALATSEQH